MNLFDVLFAKKLGGGSPFPPVIKRVTGNPIEFSDGADAPLVKCTTAIQGNQDLHGYDKPWVGGAGKNKLNDDAVVQGSYADSTLSNRCSLRGNKSIVVVVGTTITISHQNSSIRFGVGVRDNNDNPLYDSGWKEETFTFTSTHDGYLTISFSYADNSSITPDNVKDDRFQIEYGSTATAWTPYSNICPITAYDEGTISVEDENEVVQQTSTTTFSNSIYRGSEDVVNGEVTGDRLKIVFDGSSDENWIAEDSSVGQNFYINIPDTLPIQYAGTGLISNMFESSPLGSMRVNKILISSGKNLNVPVGDLLGINTVEDWKTWLSTHNLEIVYNIDPTASSIIPTNLPIKSLFGYNHIESSTGEMTIDYITDAYQNFVDTVESALPSNTRNLLTASKGGVKAFDIFKTLDEPKTPEAPAEESKPEEKETEEGAKK